MEQHHAVNEALMAYMIYAGVSKILKFNYRNTYEFQSLLALLCVKRCVNHSSRVVCDGSHCVDALDKRVARSAKRSSWCQLTDTVSSSTVPRLGDGAGSRGII
jgi:hypothetical protein